VQVAGIRPGAGKLAILVQSLYIAKYVRTNQRYSTEMFQEMIVISVLKVNILLKRRITCSMMLFRAALARADVSEENVAPIIRAKTIGELGTLAVTSNRRTLLIYQTYFLFFNFGTFPAVANNDW
jgi:hypothetical protein